MDYRADYRGTHRDVLFSPGVLDLVNDRAQRGAEYARSRAPVETGEYRRSITVEENSRAGDRFGAVVYADAPYSWEVEQRHHVFAGIVDVMEH